MVVAGLFPEELRVNACEASEEPEEAPGEPSEGFTLQLV